ncbi:unnamed protein product [Paramecium primaurelia]|uniref:Uncharacterized protein n=1 Tax=Paramecium primaurelia TaxID=5886 RepID=A0A8S1LRL6_PARPR|nr:unnamed protein product [Paramecium primaurelia]
MEYQSVPQSEQYRYEKAQVDSSLLGDAQKNFAKKVFSIVGFQLMATSLVAYGAMSFKFIETLCEILYIPAVIATIVTGIWLYLSKSSARKFPLNYILLSIFTLGEAIALAITCAQISDPELIFQAFLITTGIVVALATYAMTTKNDLSYHGAAIFLFSFGCCIAGITYFIFRSSFAYQIYLIGGAIMLGFYLVYDIQLIIGDKQLRLTVDDYILGSIMIYTDIIKIFIRVLKILLKEKKEK